MFEYYGVLTPSSDFFMHYGVKGMRWGVRKAIESKNDIKLAEHHRKAMRKLAQLKKRADRKYQKEEAKENAIAGAAGVGLGALGGLASYGIVKGQMAAQNALFPNSRYYTIMHPVGLYGLSGLSAAGGLGLLGNSAVNAYRSTKTGNKRAVAKYNKFKNEMNNAFKGTMYGKNSKYGKYNKNLIRQAKKQGKTINEIAEFNDAVSRQKSSIVPDQNKPKRELTKEESRALSAIARGEVQPYRRKGHW